MSTPLPATLVFLSTIATLPVSSKIRFLGCITTYSTTTGVMTLTHRYPNDTTTSTVNVSIDVPLPTLESFGLKEWVHVIGYIQADRSIQAITLWKAQGLDLANYENTVKEVVAMREDNFAKW